jgi:GTP-binding protein
MDTMQEYLTKRESLKKVFILVDGSIPPQDIDFDFMDVLTEDQISFEIIVTKTDKTNQKELYKNSTAFQKKYEERFHKKPELFMTSSVKGRGKDQILKRIDDILFV